jgi:hypothetical protein
MPEEVCTSTAEHHQGPSARPLSRPGPFTAGLPDRVFERRLPRIGSLTGEISVVMSPEVRLSDPRNLAAVTYSAGYLRVVGHTEVIEARLHRLVMGSRHS